MAVFGLAVVGCSSSKSNNTAAGTSSSTTATTASTGGSGGTGGSNSNATDLTALQTAVKSLKNVTFKATYTSTDTSGKQTTTTFEQQGSKYAFVNGGTSTFNDGTTTYSCTASSGPPSCYSLGTGSSPLAATVALYNGSTLLPLIQTWQSQVDAKLAGVSVTFSDQSFAGQASKCVNWSYQGQSAKWCITNSGLIAYYGGSGTGGAGSFQLSDYSSTVADADFKPPANASTVTIPSGISIPSIP